MPDYEDDLTIPEDENLLRRIHPSWIIFDDNLKCKRPTSQAFCNSGGEENMSVFLGSGIYASGRTPQDVLNEFPAIAAISAGWARACRQRVARDPLPEEPAHGVVAGRKNTNTRKRLAERAHWIIPP